MMDTEKKYTSRYEEIYAKLEKTTNMFLKCTEPKEIQDLIRKSKNKSEDGMENRFIEIPHMKKISSTIRERYTNIDYLKGEIGTLDATQQYDGIINMALLMLMSNRLTKYYKAKINNDNEQDEEKKEIYKKNQEKLYNWKNNAITDLIASIYVLKETEDEYSDDFSYGRRKDNYKRNTFVIDLPFFGQICVHCQMSVVKEVAQNKAKSIIERKRELGQISKEEEIELINKINEDTIIPKYSGKLYEYNAAFPVDCPIEEIEEIKKSVLDNKIIEDIDEKYIQKLYDYGINAREIYYMGVKLGFSKTQLEKIVQLENNQMEKINVKEMGRSTLIQTNAEERKIVQRHEEKIEKSQDIDLNIDK